MKKLYLTILLTILFCGGAETVFAKSVLPSPTLGQMVKAAEIAGTTFLPVYQSGEYVVQLMSPVSFFSKNEEVGVEVYARAWKGTEALGFGTDGTTEIERFRFYRPETEVRDNKNGDIVQVSLNRNGEVTNKYRKDPEEAFIEQLFSTIKVSHKPDTGQIILGKRGNTTSTFYPVAGANDPVDGRVSRGINQNESWATIHDSTGNGTQVTSGSGQNHIYLADDGTNWDAIYRSVYCYATSPIGTDIPSSGTQSLFAEGTDGDSHNASVVLDFTTPASFSTLANGDYDVGGWAGVLQSDTQIDIGSWGTGAYKDFALNAAGIANINTSGDTCFGTRSSPDFNNSEPTKASGTSDALVSYADTVGSTQDPRLVVIHAAAAGGGGFSGSIDSWEE